MYSSEFGESISRAHVKIDIVLNSTVNNSAEVLSITVVISVKHRLGQRQQSSQSFHT